MTKKLISYLKLMRIKHYVKNFLIFLPLVFGKRFFEIDILIDSILGFISFSLLASTIYIINDIKDVEKDKAHPTKCKRPIASGTVSKTEARVLLIIIFILCVFVNFLAGASQVYSWGVLFLYFIMNIAYSNGLKNVPLLDVSILATGFLLRLFYGSALTGIDLSPWFCLTTILASFYLGFGKRRNEFKISSDKSREVLNFYSQDFLDKSMHMCMTLAIVFYSLWTIDMSSSSSFAFVWTVPLLLLIVLKYNYNIEKESDGDPTEVILSDPVLLILIISYMSIMFGLLYIIK